MYFITAFCSFSPVFAVLPRCYWGAVHTYHRSANLAPMFHLSPVAEGNDLTGQRWFKRHSSMQYIHCSMAAQHRTVHCCLFHSMHLLWRDSGSRFGVVETLFTRTFVSHFTFLGDTGFHLSYHDHRSVKDTFLIEVQRGRPGFRRHCAQPSWFGPPPKSPSPIALHTRTRRQGNILASLHHLRRNSDTARSRDTRIHWVHDGRRLVS